MATQWVKNASKGQPDPSVVNPIAAAGAYEVNETREEAAKRINEAADAPAPKKDQIKGSKRVLLAVQRKSPSMLQLKKH